MSVLAAKNVQYGPLKDISCAFEYGRLYTIIGDTGSGKTTLFSLLAGLIHPEKGEITVQDESLKRIGGVRHRRENVSLLLGFGGLFPTLTALENVLYPLEMQGFSGKEAKKQAAALLDTVGIIGRDLHKRPRSLTPGQRQRVAIARALAARGRIILADEPTGALDEESSGEIFGAFHRLVRWENYCVILFTRDEMAAHWADVVYRLERGRLIRKTADLSSNREKHL